MPQKGEASKVMQKGSCQGGSCLHGEITSESVIMPGGRGGGYARGSCLERSHQGRVMPEGSC